jgi:chemotaxis family two-component system sensor kinase Cph1
MTSHTTPDVDLSNCDREPIHIPGSILPHGAMLVVDPITWNIEQTAGDCQTLLGASSGSLVGGSLHDIFSAAQISGLSRLVLSSSLGTPRHLLDPALRTHHARPIDASIHLSDGALVIEFEDADLADHKASDPLLCIHEMIDGLDDTPTLHAYCQIAAERVRTVAGYDRVMVYRFMEDDSGWVFAEAKRGDLSPLLDLHYPASDIPKQARALYVRSPIRLITQIDYAPAPLHPALNPRSGKPLDMSHATLRDVSPIHREYLRNMGVNASMSISILREGKLWGLIACHHQTPRRLPRHLRAICELFGSIFSLQLEARLRAEQFEASLSSRKMLSSLMQALASEDDYAKGLATHASTLLHYISAGGLALPAEQQRGGVSVRVNSRIHSVGNTPDETQIGTLTDWLCIHMKDFDGVFVTDRLGEVWPEAKEFAELGSGLLAISVSREPRDFLLWFRPEAVETVTWGGDPNKPATTGPNGDRLTPRKSFEAWTETVRGRASPWNDADNAAAFDLRVALLEVVLRRIDAAARERQRALEHEKLLMAELDHRVKNTLANIQALVSQTSRGAESLADFAQSLERRIRAMSRAHSLLTESRWQSVSIESLLHDELEAHNHSPGRATLSGPPALLTPKAALALSLAVHELCTNATKYGSLSVAAGKVSVDWKVLETGSIVLTWTERDGPAVVTPSRRGFGSTLIERALAFETGGQSTLKFAAEGVTCEIRLPPSVVQLVEPLGLNGQSANAIDAVVPTTAMSAKRILVIEDSIMVVMLIETVLTDLGWTVVGPASRVKEALELVETESFDGVLLDINLDGEMTWDIAALLQNKGVPFVFSTGYDGSSFLPDRFAHQRVLNKPFGPQQIELELNRLFASVP